jgi:hypothetical protein
VNTAGRHHVDSDSDDSKDSGQIMKKGKAGSNDHGSLKTNALQAGKKYAICNLLWLDPAAIWHIAYITKASSEMELLLDGPDDLKEQAQDILRSLPVPLHPHIDTRWFKEQVHRICNISYLFIFLG